VIELIMEKIQQLIPSEAWSCSWWTRRSRALLSCPRGQGKEGLGLRLKIGEGIAGWVARPASRPS